MAEKLDDDGFSLRPITLTEDAWFYEGKKGLTLAVQLRGTMQSILGTVEIPWRRLKPSLRRLAAYEKRKAKKMKKRSRP